MEETKTAKRTENPTAKRTAKPIENMKGGLWLTTMGRITLDNYGGEAFSEPYDKKIMTAEELTRGISFKKFIKRLNKYMVLEGLKWM